MNSTVYAHDPAAAGQSHLGLALVSESEGPASPVVGLLRQRGVRLHLRTTQLRDGRHAHVMAVDPPDTQLALIALAHNHVEVRWADLSVQRA